MPTAAQEIEEQAQGKHIVLYGPTASGKTALALELAAMTRARSGQPVAIINMDSQAVYGDIPILSAAPNPAERAQCPHYLLGHVAADVRYSVGQYSREVAALLPSLKGQRLIFVGGTGLYAQALLHGLSHVPDIPADIAQIWRDHVAADPLNAHAQLRAIEPATKITANDQVRIARALAVYHHTGHSLSHWQHAPTTPLLAHAEAFCVYLDCPRAPLYARINSRFAAMMDQGALAEVAALAPRALDPSLPIMRAHGVPWLLAHLRGEIELAHAIDMICQDSRRLAKRQTTWARGRMADFAAITPDWARG